VLCEGGTYLTVAWDTIGRNPASKIAHDTVASLYPDDPPSFLARTPFGYADPEWIERDLRAAGFRKIGIDTVELASRPTSSLDAAIGLVAGCPLAAEIQERNAAGLQPAIEATADALGALEKDGRLDSRLSAHIATATK